MRQFVKGRSRDLHFATSVRKSELSTDRARSAARFGARSRSIRRAGSQRTRDTVTTTVAVLVFSPAAFFVGSAKQTAAELALLKGELEALEQGAIRKNCVIEFRHEPPKSRASQSRV